MNYTFCTRFLTAAGVTLGTILATPMLASAQDCPYASAAEASQILGRTVMAVGTSGACAIGDRAHPQDAILIRVRKGGNDPSFSNLGAIGNAQHGKSAAQIFDGSLHRVRNPEILSGIGDRAYMITTGSQRQQIIEVLKGGQLISVQTMNDHISADRLKALARAVVAHAR